MDPAEPLLAQRARLNVGTRAVGIALLLLPPLAFLLLIVVTLPRCTAGVDPFAGTPGYVLCPMRCDGCQGPWIVEDGWVYEVKHNSRGHKNNGAFYYCQPPSGSASTPSDYQVYFAPTALTYLLNLLFALPFAALLGYRTHRTQLRAQSQLDEQLRVLELQQRRAIPTPERSAVGLILGGLAFIGLTAAGAVAIIGVEWLIW